MINHQGEMSYVIGNFCCYKRNKPCYMLHIVGIFQEFCTNCWKISVGRERRLWHPNYKSIYSMSQTCFTQLFSIIPCGHSKNKQTSFDFLGFCLRLPETKTKLVGKTQNQLSLHCRKIIKYDKLII